MKYIKIKKEIFDDFQKILDKISKYDSISQAEEYLLENYTETRGFVLSAQSILNMHPYLETKIDNFNSFKNWIHSQPKGVKINYNLLKKAKKSVLKSWLKENEIKVEYGDESDYIFCNSEQPKDQIEYFYSLIEENQNINKGFQYDRCTYLLGDVEKYLLSIVYPPNKLTAQVKFEGIVYSNFEFTIEQFIEQFSIGNECKLFLQKFPNYNFDFNIDKLSEEEKEKYANFFYFLLINVLYKLPYSRSNYFDKHKILAGINKSLTNHESVYVNIDYIPYFQHIDRKRYILSSKHNYLSGKAKSIEYFNALANNSYVYLCLPLNIYNTKEEHDNVLKECFKKYVGLYDNFELDTNGLCNDVYQKLQPRTLELVYMNICNKKFDTAGKLFNNKDVSGYEIEFLFFLHQLQTMTYRLFANDKSQCTKLSNKIVKRFILNKNFYKYRWRGQFLAFLCDYYNISWEDRADVIEKYGDEIKEKLSFVDNLVFEE